MAPAFRGTLRREPASRPPSLVGIFLLPMLIVGGALLYVFWGDLTTGASGHGEGRDLCNVTSPATDDYMKAVFALRNYRAKRR